MKLLCSMITTALILAVSAAAQTSSSSVAGSVADPTNQVIPGAVVTLVNEGSGDERSMITNEAGDFVFTGLVPGTYTLRVKANGFRPLERKGNVLVSSTRMSVGNLQLEVGSVSESIEVVAQGAQVQTDSAEHSELVDQKEMQFVSVRGRDPMSFLAIMPGVQKGVDSDFLGGSYGSNVPSFQGLSTSTNTIMSDGVNGGDGGGGGMFSASVNLDAIGEVKVLENNYNAEYGRSGGAMVNLITKSGGREFHGAAWANKRHEQFNANNYFLNAAGIHKSIYRFQTLGGDVGGPLPIPVINPHRDKLFFFILFEDARLKNAAPLERWTMPTALERQGNFSQSVDLNGKLITVKDPLTGNPFPGNIVPQSRLNQYGVAMLNIFPQPNYAGQGYNFLYQEPYINKPRQSLDMREDYRPTNKDTISFTYKRWGANETGIHVAAGSAKWGLVPMQYQFDAAQGTINYTRVISPHVINEFMIGAMHDREESPAFPPLGWDPIERQNRGLAGLGQINNTWNPLNFIPKLTFGGIPTAYSAAAVTYDGREPLSGWDTNITGTNNLTYIRGAHTFKAGLYYELSRFGQAATSNFGGTFDFSNSSLDPTNTGYAFANAAVGHFASYTEDLGRGPDNSKRPTYAWFVQDTWKASRKLTIDLGVRMYKVNWALQSDGVSSAFVLSRFDPTWGGNPPVLFRPISTAGGRRAVNPLTGDILAASYIGNVVPGTGNNCTAIPCKLNGIVLQNDTSYEPGRGFKDSLPIQVDPRIGIAFDPTGNGKMAIRASFGEFHVASTGGNGGLDRGPAYVYTRQLLSADISPTLFQTTPVASPISVSGVVKNQKFPVVYQWMIGIQRDIGRAMVLDVNFVGNQEHFVSQNGINYNVVPLGRRFDPAYADPSNTAVALPDAFLRPYPGYLDMIVNGPATSTHYNALQAKVQRRFAAGLELDANYTYSKSMGYNLSGSNATWSAQFDANLFRGPTSTDQTHIFNLSYVYSLPNGSKLLPGKVSKQILDGWQISGITTFASGFPQNITLTTADSYDFTGGGDFTPGVVLTCSPELPHGSRGFSRFFDTSCVHRPTGRGDYGNNFNGYKFRGPGFNNHDLSIFKTFQITEKKSLLFRWETFNILNHAEASAVNNTARFDASGNQVNAALGTVTSTLPERRMQGSIRFTF